MATLLIVHHSPTETVRTLTDAVVAGAADDAITDVQVVVRQALEATADDVLAAERHPPRHAGELRLHVRRAQALLRLDLPRGRRRALRPRGRGHRGGGGRKPYGLYVHGRYDTAGAVRSVLTIVQALPWRQAADVLDVVGEITPGDRAAAYELGGTIAALLSP